MKETWESIARQAIRLRLGTQFVVREWRWGYQDRVLLTVHGGGLRPIAQFAGGPIPSIAWMRLVARVAHDADSITTPQAAVMLGITRGRLRHWHQEGRLNVQHSRGMRRAGRMTLDDLWTALEADQRNPPASRPLPMSVTESGRDEIPDQVAADPEDTEGAENPWGDPDDNDDPNAPAPREPFDRMGFE